MFGQTFQVEDVGFILALFLLELLLSIDNAIVLGLISSRLEPEDRGKALAYGMVGAFAMRLAALATAFAFLRSWWVLALGSAYLLFLGIRHFTVGESDKARHHKAQSFWKVVLTIELLDFVFAIDSVFAGVAFVRGQPHKVWVVWVGGVLGIVALRAVAAMFARVLKKYEALEGVAYALIVLLGVRLGLVALSAAASSGALPLSVPELSDTVFYTLFGLITLAGSGFVIVRRRRAGLIKPEVGSDSDTTGNLKPE